MHHRYVMKQKNQEGHGKQDLLKIFRLFIYFFHVSLSKNEPRGYIHSSVFVSTSIKHLARTAISVLFAMAAVGCASTAGPGISRSPQRAIPNKDYLFKRISAIRGDYCHPPYRAYQDLYWKGNVFTWIFHLPPEKESHAGIVLKRGADAISKGYGQEWLTFHQRPVEMASHLKLALFSDREKTIKAESEFTIDHYVTEDRFGWNVIAIPLSSFVVTGTNSEAFNWNSLYAFQFNRADAEQPANEIRVDHFSIVQSQDDYVSLAPHSPTIEGQPGKKEPVQRKKGLGAGPVPRDKDKKSGPDEPGRKTWAVY